MFSLHCDSGLGQCSQSAVKKESLERRIRSIMRNKMSEQALKETAPEMPHVRSRYQNSIEVKLEQFTGQEGVPSTASLDS